MLLAQEIEVPPDESVTSNIQVSTADRILGTIPDGTPPPPAESKPGFMVPKKDIIDTSTQQEGGRTITVREIKPIVLPSPPAEPIPTAPTDASRFPIAETQLDRPKFPIVNLSATVYQPKDTAPRTLVRWWPLGKGESIEFWSSADFTLIAGGIQSFADSTGATHLLTIGCGKVDTDRLTDLQAAKAPTIPEFPAGQATVAYVGKAPGEDEALVIQSLLHLYNKNHATLLTAYQGREQSRLALAAELKAHPPKPKDITLNYWRTEKPAPANGGAK